MNQSESIAEIAKALMKVQSEMGLAIKSSENPFFKSQYADLSSVWDACREPLVKNGLSIVQRNLPSENGVTLETILLHVSGEWISGSLFIPAPKDNPQGYGSALTYARRYGLSAMVGVCTEDDDAESATQRNKKSEHMTDVQKKEMKALMEEKVITDDEKEKAIDWMKGNPSYDGGEIALKKLKDTIEGRKQVLKQESEEDLPY